MTELLRAEGLTKYYSGRTSGLVKAVDGVTLRIESGETLAVVGESGSGKTTLGRCLLFMEQPTAGRVFYQDREVGTLPPRQRRALLGGAQVVYQDPFSSLNPHRTAFQQVLEPLEVLSRTGGTTRAELRDRALEALDAVGIGGADVHKYPGAFSGGQRQRIGIARAVAVRPAFVFCDEPLSSLDLSVQAQVLRLLARLQTDLGLTYLFVSHDLAVVRDISTRTAVMLGGRIVELGPTEAVFTAPLHPYTRALLAAIPLPDPRGAATRRAARRQLRTEDSPKQRYGPLTEATPGHWFAPPA
ncbi:MAG: ATP-binding cassette domain-containing protein [Bifidobacteriaceae bacterium]|jgi:ABC-type oligopeptide transport system ATPase subunit|nr:ATP-binding cassette domain-containing protein [Bifidobacteriaceae bacterium]